MQKLPSAHQLIVCSKRSLTIIEPHLSVIYVQTQRRLVIATVLFKIGKNGRALSLCEQVDFCNH